MNNLNYIENVESSTTKNNSFIDATFQVINESFAPIIGVMAISGLAKGVLAILVSTGILVPEQNVTNYQILAAISNSVFYFLPILLGFSIAKTLGMNIYIGALLGAALLEPNFTSLLNQPNQNFFSIPVIPADFGGSVFPIFIATLLLFVLQKQLAMLFGRTINEYLVYTISLFLIVPFIIIAFGDIGVDFGSKLAREIQTSVNMFPVISGAVLGGTMMFMVMFGLHWGLLPLIIANINNDGDNLAPLWACASFAQVGVALACFICNRKHRTISFFSLFAGLFAGITEPITYGIILKYRRVIPIVVFSGAIGGALNGYFHIRLMDIGFHSVLSMTLFTPFIHYLVGVSISLLTACLLTLYFRRKIL